MLVRFVCKNFLSFNKEVEFLNTVSSKKQKLKHHIYKQKNSHIPILKGAAIYGANASGKTNFLDAIQFSTNVILNNGQDHSAGLRNNQNKFSDSNESKFDYEFKIDDKIFNYGFVVNDEEVLEEWLYQRGIGSASVEKPIFIRQKGKFSDDDEIIRIVTKDKKDESFINYSKNALMKDKLFLHRLKEDNIKYVDKIFNWFERIKIIEPNTKLIPHVFFEDDNLQNFMKEVFCKMDDKIDNVKFKKTKIKSAQDIQNVDGQLAQNSFINLQKLDKENGGIITSSGRAHMIILKKEKGQMFQQEILIERSDQEFTMSQESRGINRLCDLIPFLFDLIKNNRIYLIDELESSLHPHLARALIKMFFELSKDNESQLIFTTHDCNLMDLEILREDEIWFAEKDNNMHTNLYSLTEFKMRPDYKNIEQGYLQGRFGAIPFIGNAKVLIK